VGMKGTFWNEIAHPQLGGGQFHFKMFLQFMEEQTHFWKCCPNTQNVFGRFLRIQNEVMGNNDLAALV